MMWFDYPKTFDSVPHPWIIEALELAKVSKKILIAIRNIMDLWAKQELEDLDIKTIKTLTAHASFHINSDIDRL